MRKLLGIGIIALGVAFSGSAIAADGGAIYKQKCSPCHGADGQGTAMAPAFKGNAWVKGAAEAEISDTITKGREGAAKKYKQFAIGMPKQNIAGDDLKAVVAHLKGLAK
ncbi:MAG: cytochrome c [Deltaproteobacteria bacterium]|nr:cytochrome c [Deltaproteobacteria bacterium]